MVQAGGKRRCLASCRAGNLHVMLRLHNLVVRMIASPSPPSRRSRASSRKPKNHNRISEILRCLARLGIASERQLAHLCGISPSQLSRIRSGACIPTFAVMVKLARGLEHLTGRPIDPRDILGFDGSYPTPIVGDLFSNIEEKR